MITGDSAGAGTLGWAPVGKQPVAGRFAGPLHPNRVVSDGSGFGSGRPIAEFDGGSASQGWTTGALGCRSPRVMRNIDDTGWDAPRKLVRGVGRGEDVELVQIVEDLQGA